MGFTLTARDQQTGRRCVIKLAKSEGATVPFERVRRMFQEARALSMLQHPRIANALAFGADEATGIPYLALELVDGSGLDDLIRSTGALEERRAARLALDIASALAHAHERGVLHRDLKPANVMIERDDLGGERARVLDFGLAKLAKDKEELRLTAPGTAVGTPWYMSPEQILGGSLDGRSDLYALGCLLYAMLTGQPPYTSSNLIEAMKQQLREPVPELPRASAGMQALFRSLMEKSRFDRPANAAAVCDALEKLILGTADPKDRTSGKRVVPPPAETIPKQNAEGAEHLDTVIAPQPMDSAELDSGSEPAFFNPTISNAPPPPPSVAPVPPMPSSKTPLLAAGAGVLASVVISVFLLRTPAEEAPQPKPQPMRAVPVIKETAPAVVERKLLAVDPVPTTSTSPKLRSIKPTKKTIAPTLPEQPKKDVEMPLW